MLDIYGGEYKWDRYMVRLYNARGANRGVSIRYGKNLTDIQQDENISNVYTGVYPYWVDADGNLTQLPEKIVNAPGTYDFIRILPLDLSEEFEEAPTEAELKQAAEAYIKSNEIGVPHVSLTVSFVQLEQTEEYKGMALLETVLLCDTVNVEFAQLGVSATAKCVRTVYDVLLNRYDSIDLGDARTNIADTIAEQKKEIEKAPSTTDMWKAITNATNIITGNNGGYVVLHSSTGSKEPDEILIMDTPDIQTATKVWRWNKSGLGYSSAGYNGPYGLAMTADGSIVADFITTGILTANLIKAGILQSFNGATSINMETGVASLTGSLATTLQSVGGQNYKAEVRGTGISFYQDDTEIGYVDVRLMAGQPILLARLNSITGDSLYFKNIWLQRSDDTAFTAFSVTSGGALEIGNLGSLYIGGIGGTVAWRTVELVTGGTALALCQV